MNRVETSAFQAGRLQHRTGGTDANQSMMCHRRSFAAIAEVSLGWPVRIPVIERSLRMQCCRRISGLQASFTRRSKLLALAGSS